MSADGSFVFAPGGRTSFTVEAVGGTMTLEDPFGGSMVMDANHTAMTLAGAGTGQMLLVTENTQGAPGDGGGGVTDHGLLTGLGNDDHTQYFNETRGDVRYAQLSAFNALVSTLGGADPFPQYMTSAEGNAAYSLLGHAHTIVDVTGLTAALGAKSDAGHTHTAAETTDFNEAAQDAIGAMVDSTLVYADGTPALGRAAITGHITIAAGSNAAALGSFTIAQLNAAVSDADLSPTGHAHTIVDVTGLTAALGGKSDVGHTHTAANVTDFNEAAQDAIGAMVDATLVYTDATPALARAPITGHINIAAGSNTATLGSFTFAELNAALTVSNVAAQLHTHVVSQIVDFAEGVDDRVAALLVAGANITLTYNDVANTLTIAATGGGGGGGSGDVVGPAAAADTAVPVFDGTTGKLLKESPVLITANGSVVLPENSTPTAPAAGTMKLFSRKIANRLMPAFVGPSGLDSTLQPLLARNKVGYWCPPGNSTIVPGVLGFAAPTTTGFTITARFVATTNLFTRMRRLGFVTAATAGTVGHWRHTSLQFTVGDPTSGLGGFTYIKRFGISDAAAVAGARMFVGMRASVTPANVEPSTLTNCFGIGHGAADTNMKLFYGGSAAQTPIDLGANFPCNTLSTDVYELALFSAPSSGDVHWEVTRLNTGDVASGTITNSGTTVLPSNTTLIGPWGYRTNNATALAVGLDVMSAYIETDS